MKSRRIFSDIDGTLVFSHAKEIGERVLVEVLNGKEQSFMTKIGYDLLQKVGRDEFVPITSRSQKQYERLKFFFDGSDPKYALVDNGGVLLVDGVKDAYWLDETKKMISEDAFSMECFENMLKGKAEIKHQDDMILFIKTGMDLGEVASLASGFGLMIYNHADKIYVCSKRLSKANGVCRFRSRYPSAKCIVAGDSEMDLPMAEHADDSYFALPLKNVTYNVENMHFLSAERIAEQIFGM